MKILARHLNSFITFARVRNIPAKDILAVMECPPPDLQDETATVNVGDFYKVVEYISRSLKDDQLGLRVGAFVQLQHLGAIYQLTLKSTTVEEVLFYCRTYLERTFPLVNINMTTSGNSATIGLSIDNDHVPVNRIILDYMLTLMSREISVVSADDCDIAISSPFCGPGYPASWKNGTRFTLVFSEMVLKAALKDSSHWGFEVLLPAYLGMMEGLNPDGSFSNKVKLAALNMADPRLPDLQMTTRAFNITPRTLQRRLADEGSSYRQITEDLKRKICDLLIRHERYSIQDISHILGYSEPAAFIHSFRKWHGIPPAKMKEQIRS